MISMNLTDLVVMASVFTRMVRVVDYFRFVAPGVTIVALFAAAFVIGREINVETRRGFNEYLLSLPIDRWELVLGRILAGGLRGVIYCTPLLIVTFQILRYPTPAELVTIIFGLFMMAMGISGLAISLAATLRSFETFTTSRSFLYLLLMFCSTIFYPASVISATLFRPLVLFAQINPLSLAADLLRATLMGDPPLTPVILQNLVLFSAVFMGVGSLIYGKAIQRT